MVCWRLSTVLSLWCTLQRKVNLSNVGSLAVRENNGSPVTGTLHAPYTLYTCVRGAQTSELATVTSVGLAV